MAFKIIGNGLSPFVRKTRVFFAEKGIPYELEPLIPFDVSAEYKTKSPLGKIPCLEHDGRAAPRLVGDLRLRREGAAAAAALPERPLGLRPGALARGVHGRRHRRRRDGADLPGARDQEADERPARRGARRRTRDEKALPVYCDYLTERSATNQYLVGGRFTIADIAVASPFVNLGHAGVTVDAKRWPKLAAYVERIHSRPSFKALIEEERAGLPK